MSWGPSDELEHREHQASERALHRAERNWQKCGVWEDEDALDDDETADRTGGHVEGPGMIPEPRPNTPNPPANALRQGEEGT